MPRPKMCLRFFNDPNPLADEKTWPTVPITHLHRLTRETNKFVKKTKFVCAFRPNAITRARPNDSPKSATRNGTSRAQDRLT